jgi:predicted transcriptional regulator
MPSINITLPDAIAAKLVALAEAERRRPRDQAAVILIAALEREALRKTPAGGAR